MNIQNYNIMGNLGELGNSFNSLVYLPRHVAMTVII